MTVVSARPAMPLWDEEVVPALRKRTCCSLSFKVLYLTPVGLESESKTLAHKLSAISLPPGEETKNATFSDRNVNQKQIPPSPALPRLSYTSQDRKNQPGKQSSDHMSISPTTIVNGTSRKASRSPSYQRSRTYSSPYASDYPDSPPNGNATPKSKHTDSPRLFPHRTTDVKPTRIPKVARQMTTPNTPNTYRTNGYNSHNTIVTASQPPELPYRQASLEYPRSSQRDAVIPTSSSRSTFDLPRSTNIKTFTTVLLQESPPFPTDTTMSSGLSQQNEDILRPSVDSEEGPYEHWYRGEVSRNGGVGELKVGRRQQMLDIANYGHLIRNQKMAITKTQPVSILDESHQYHRKRAGSIGGLTRKERDSLYLDEVHADEVERVLDEDPPTDLEKEDTHSIMDEFDMSTQAVAFAYLPSEADIRNSTASTAEQWTSTVGAHELRSVTPTPLARPSSRQTQNLPPSRIPGPSSRRSSDSRSTVNNSSTTTSTPVPVTRTKSSSPETVYPVPGPSSSVSLRMQAVPSSTASSPAASTSSTPQKRGISPSVKKTRPPVKKAKTIAGSKRDNRISVAMYPAVEGGEELADAIPSWTQPIQKEGNWDEVRSFYSTCFPRWTSFRRPRLCLGVFSV
jgi:hypothetical protein